MMMPKPAHLAPRYGEQFGDASVAAAYEHRPSYPDSLWPKLRALVREPWPVLDVGAGTGAIARPLAAAGLAVEAIEPAAAMVAIGRTLPGGEALALRWVTAPAETAPLSPPYGLIVAGQSLHWLDWAVVMPRFRAALAPGAVLAIVGLAIAPLPWAAALQPIIDRYSTNREYQPYDLIAELTQRRHFRVIERTSTPPERFTQSIDAYIESFHARNGFSRDRMTPANAAAFDAAVRALVLPFTTAERVAMDISAIIITGEPAPSAG